MSTRTRLAVLLAFAWLGCADSGSDKREVVEVASPAKGVETSTDAGSLAPPSGGGGLSSGTLPGSQASGRDAAVSSVDAGAGTVPPLQDGGAPPDAAASAAFSCLLNSDCVQKDVGSCCGYYPRCANVGGRVCDTQLQRWPGRRVRLSSHRPLRVPGEQVCRRAELAAHQLTLSESSGLRRPRSRCANSCRRVDRPVCANCLFSWRHAGHKAC